MPAKTDNWGAKKPDMAFLARLRFETVEREDQSWVSRGSCPSRPLPSRLISVTRPAELQEMPVQVQASVAGFQESASLRDGSTAPRKRRRADF